MSRRLEPTEAQREAVEEFARLVVRFGLAVPAILALESMRPLSWVGSQAMHVLTPSIGAFLPVHRWEALASLLEHREGLDLLLERIEALDAERRGGS